MLLFSPAKCLKGEQKLVTSFTIRKTKQDPALVNGSDATAVSESSASHHEQK